MLKYNSRVGSTDLSYYQTLFSETEAKKWAPRPFNKRAHSLSPVLMRSKTASLLKKCERNCQSLTPSTDTIKKPMKHVVPSGSECTDPPPTYPLDNEHEDNSSHKVTPAIPQFVLTRMLRFYTTKKRDFIKLRKGFIAQQNTLLESYAQLKDMERRAGIAKEDGVGDVSVVDISGWPAHDLLLLIRDDLAAPLTDEISGSLGPHVLQQVSKELNPIPDEIVAVCDEIMARRLELLKLYRNKQRTDKNSHGNISERKSKTMEFDADTENLHRMVNTTAENLKAKINYVYELAKVPWVDRDTLIKKLERIQKENMVLQSKLDEFIKKQNEIQALSDVVPNYQNICEELAKERAARESLKQVVSSAESMLRVARARIATLERQLKDRRAELESSKIKQKQLEELVNRLAKQVSKQTCRNRESNFDARSKKLREVSKTGESTIETLSRQRDALELRVKELHEQAEQTEQTVKQREAEQRSRIECLQAKLATQERSKNLTEGHVVELETKIKQLEQQLEAIRERSVTLVDMDCKRYLDFVPSKESAPSDKETEIWKELQVTRMTLSRMEEELHQSRADKDSLLNSLCRIAQDGSDNIQEKMATELLDREQKIGHLQRIIKSQQDNLKLMKQSIKQYENQLCALRHEVRRLRNYDSYNKDIPYQELQTELLDLHMEIDSLTRERKALVTAAASRALMLERHERSADLFARLVRARRDICALLDGRTTPPSLDDSNQAELSRSLTSLCNGAAEMWSALRAERKRVLNLESAVLAQSLQLEREGQVRIKLEKKGTLLEKEVLRVHRSVSSETVRARNKQNFPWHLWI